MFCSKCGNKIPPQTTVCKFCGYEMSEDDDEEVVQVKATPKANNQIVKKTSSNITNSYTTNKIFAIFSIMLILAPFIVVPLAYYQYKLTLFFVITCIIGIFVEILGIYVVNNLSQDKKRLLKFSKLGIYLFLLCLAFSTTFIISSIAMNSKALISEYKNLLASIISIGSLSIIFSIASNLLIKYN